MKKLAILILSPALAFAGPPSVDIATAPAAAYWITPTIDIRARYEFGEVDTLDPSHAFTIRERIGLKTREWNGFSAFVEGEFTQTAIDDFNGGAPGVNPLVAGNTVIIAPENNELNQGYLQYKGFDTIFRAGRQRIIYDNAAFIGNVGWRQNEQTYDALSLNSTYVPGLTLQYSYINQVNRIFGSDANGFFGDIGSNTHLLNASYTGIEGYTLGGYVYLMDFDGLDIWDNNTFGISAKTKQFGLDFYGELAFQNEAGIAQDDESMYAHFTVAKMIDTQTLTLGLEHLDAGFRTPLATLHAFNGFADVFNGQRATGATGGLTDLYVSHSIPLFCGIKMTNTIHAFGDNEISTGRGYEIDSVFAKKFDDHFLAIAKLAHFETESALRTTTRLSLELNYTF
ncbi:MAG: hypothetical protein H7Y36_05200 [Armatimonadetes bacterium]|nr:hypothetical protein [Akkermansiaceae bacterium]